MYTHIILTSKTGIFNDNIKFKIGKWYKMIKWIADHTDAKILEDKKKNKEKM